MVSITAPPTVLTMEDYERDWRSQGWRLIIIGPTSTWREDWGEWEAIRDIVQNALDEAEAYQWGRDAQGLWIRDAGRGVAVADFLLGPPRLKPDHARGKYGEGMKIAALALLRRGYPVHVETVGRDIWMVFLEQKVNGRARTLAALWRDGSRAEGTVFHIINYAGSAYEDRFAVNLPRSAIVAEAPSPVIVPKQRYNQLISHSFPGGSRLFARDIYMRDINSPYSYNLWGFALAPDRHGPKDEADLWTDVGRLWCCVTRVDLIEVLLKMVKQPPLLESDESHRINMGAWDMGQEPVSGKDYADFITENAPLWQRAWRTICGDNAVIRTSDRWDGTVKHLGYEPISLQWGVGDTLARAILTDAALIKASQERLREVEVIPDTRLTSRQRAHLELARSIAHEVCRVRRVSAVHAAIIPPASDRVRTAGLYSRTSEEIYIAADQLESGKATVDTVIHEIAHHTSGADDLESAHSEAMTGVAAQVVRSTAKGVFDSHLAEVAW